MKQWEPVNRCSHRLTEIQEGDISISPLIISLLILLFVFVALLSGKLGYGAVGAITIVLLAITGVLNTSGALSGFSHTNVAILLYMMIVDAGLMKTSLVERIVGMVSRVGNRETALIAGFGLIAAAMARFMNAFVGVACLLPLMTGRCEQLNIRRTKVICPVMIIALTRVFLFPVGMGASTRAQRNGVSRSLRKRVPLRPF